MSMISMQGHRDLTPEDLMRMHVGKRYWGVKLDLIPRDSSYRTALEQYVEKLKDAVDNGYGLMLYGDYRGGKTSAAVVAMKAVVSRGGSAYFIRADEVAGGIIEHRMFDDDVSVAERMQTVDLLVIDDLGAETTREVGASLMERLVRWRYDNKKSLVVTVNLNLDALEKKMNEGALKVMRSMMRAVLVDGTKWFEAETGDVKRFFRDGNAKA